MLFVNTAVVEPKTFSFKLKAIINGNGWQNREVSTLFDIQVEVKGCPGEVQNVAIPGHVGDWDQHMQDISPTRGEKTLVIPTSDKF